MFSSISKILNTKKWKRFFTVSRIQVNGPISSPVADNIQPTGIYRHSWISSTSLPGLTVRKSPGNEIGCCILSEWKVKNAVRQFWLAWPFVSRKSQKVKKKIHDKHSSNFSHRHTCPDPSCARALASTAHALRPQLHTWSTNWADCADPHESQQIEYIFVFNIFLFFCFQSQNNQRKHSPTEHSRQPTN